MMREFIATAATVEEAIDLARKGLGISDDVGELEILDYPEKKKFGLFGGKPAKVRVFFDDGKPEKKAPKASKPADKPVKKAEPKAEKPAQKPAQKPAKAPQAAPKAEKPEKPSNIKINEAAREKTVTFVKDILSHMDCGEYTLAVEDIEGGFAIRLTGEGLGVVIGRRGETLDALQYLVSLCYNNSENGFVRVVLDANDYRAKRAVTLQGLARKVADQVLETQRNQSLEPMNPYERRVIIGLANEDGTPVDPDDNPMRRAPRGRGGRRGRDDRRRGDRGGRGRRDSSRTAPAAPTREKRSDAGDLPLFGRIDNK